MVAGQPDPQGDGMPAGFVHRLSPTAAQAGAGALECVARGAQEVEVVTFNPEKVFLDDAALPDPDIGAQILSRAPAGAA